MHMQKVLIKHNLGVLVVPTSQSNAQGIIPCVVSGL